MHLTLFITILLAGAELGRLSIFSFLSSGATFLHSACLSWIPNGSSHAPEMKALVCGANFSELETSRLYVATGLIHLFVVSGAHLLVLKKIIEVPLAFLPPRVAAMLGLFLLTVYAGVCEFNPPVTRSLLALVLMNEFLVGKINWPAPFKIFITGLLTLLFNTAWTTSLSFQLSWLIALGLCVGNEFFRHNSVFIRQALNYIFIFPTLLLFQFPHPLTIVLNVIFAPVLEFILFPLALCASVFPIFITPFDFMISLLQLTLSKTEMTPDMGSLEKSDLFILANWILILTVHALLHMHHVTKARKNLCLG